LGAEEKNPGVSAQAFDCIQNDYYDRANVDKKIGTSRNWPRLNPISKNSFSGNIRPAFNE
jgi:hypothetical protein